MPPPEIAAAPGLTWRPRRDSWEARWQARRDIILRGFEPKTQRLWQGKELTGAESERIAAECRRLQADMHDWSTSPDREHAWNGHVYFITDGVGVKIGFATDLQERLYDIQQHNRLKISLLTAIRGTLADEKAMHHRFEHLHIRGEWFRLESDLAEFIANQPEHALVSQNGKPL